MIVCVVDVDDNDSVHLYYFGSDVKMQVYATT